MLSMDVIERRPESCPREDCRDAGACTFPASRLAFPSPCRSLREVCYVALWQRDGGDEDLRGSVACQCDPWCGLPICRCGEDHGSNKGDDGDHRCRDCHQDYLFDQMTCVACGNLRLNEHGVAVFGEANMCLCPVPKPPTRVP